MQLLKNEITEFPGKWMELEIIVLSEAIKIQKNTTCFLASVDVSFKSSDMYASFGIQIKFRKLLRDRGERDIPGNCMYWFKESKGNNEREKVKVGVRSRE